MKQSIKKLSKNEKKFLISLLEDGSKTDAQISREIGVSKSTAYRIRKDLEKEKIILEYIPIIDLDRIGVEAFFVLMFQWTAFKDQKLTNKMLTELENDPHVIFLGNGEGSEGLTTCIFLGFKNLSEYNAYFKKFRSKYEDFLGKTVSLLIPSKEIIKHDFTDMVKYILGGEVS
jgi:DNA-binding Lrp family transcriptional regulator